MKSNINYLMNLEEFYIHFREDQDVNIAELIQNL